MKIRSIRIGITGLILAIYASSVFVTGAVRAQTDTFMEALEAYAVQIMQEQKIPGMAIAVVKDDEVIYSKCFGVKDEATRAAVDVNTVFEIGSTTKAFTTTLLAMLADQDQINWNDPVLEHLP